MKKAKVFLVLFAMIVSVISLYAGNKDKLNNCNVAAKVVTVETDKVIVAQRSLLKDTIDLPLSELIEDLQIVLLDKADEALVGQTLAIVSENYIFVKCQDNNPCKLFDKKGNFITNIGTIGQGPNEYRLIYDQQIDEANKRIYLLPWQSNKLLVFDFNGKALEPIPLCDRIPKGMFRVNKDKTVTCAMLPFKGAKAVVWTQTQDGQLLKSIAPGNLEIQPDFSNEVMSNKNSAAFDFSLFIFWGRKDYLYHYDTEKNRLVPQFTIDFGDQKMPINWYEELPNHYLMYMGEPQQISATNTVGTDYKFAILDKKTMKGAFYRLKNDFLGDISAVWPSFRDGYYVNNMDPGNLKDALEEALSKNKNMSPAMRDKLTKLKNSITENDNNYVLYGKLKR